MKAEMQVRGDAGRDLGRQVAAVGIGGVVALFGGFVGFMGALSCLAGCQGLTPGIVVAYAGLAIMAGSPLAISALGGLRKSSGSDGTSFPSSFACSR